MKYFIEYLKEEQIFEKLTQLYKDNLKNEKEKKFLKAIIEKVYNFEQSENLLGINKKSDLHLSNIFGNLYERNLSHNERKILGEFYTPTPIVKYILISAGYQSNVLIENSKLIDISCGVGSFIIQAILNLVVRFKTVYNIKDISEFTIEEAKSIIIKIKENIVGIDINPIACILCQINIHYTIFELYEIIKKDEQEYNLPLFNIKNFNALLLNDKDKYDFVIGNPPYLFIRDITDEDKKLIQKRDFKSSNGQYDYYQIFIELGIELLKDGGILGYIVPDSLLALSNSSDLRIYIYNNTLIKEIYHTGPKFNKPVVSNIIIILEKNGNLKEREKNNIKIILSDQQEMHLLQKSLEKWDFKFLIHLNDIDFGIIEHLNKDFPKLGDLNNKDGFKIWISRGVELSKTGKIIYCEKCELYFPIPKKNLLCQKCGSQLKLEHIEKIIQKIIPENRNKSFKSFLFAINRYQIKEKKFIDITKNGIKYKDLDLYEDRIIIRQLSQNNFICATYDKNISITSQSFYNLKILQTPIKEFNHLFLLGIINSTLLSYYFIKSFGSYKKLFPRILIEKIKNLPIKIPETEKEKNLAKEIIKKVKVLLEARDISGILFENIPREIDLLVFNLYQISNKDQHYILNYMKNL